MNNLTNLLLLLVLFLLYFLPRLNDTRKYFLSRMNSKKYLTTSQHGSDLLASLSFKKAKLCKFLENSTKYKNHLGVKRLLENKDVKIEEVAPQYKNQAAYSINKGDTIGICLKNKSGRYENENTMFFVFMHELAHIMTNKYEHNKEFWDNFALLIEAATHAGIYQYQNFQSNPVSYCGHNINHTPYNRV